MKAVILNLNEVDSQKDIFRNVLVPTAPLPVYDKLEGRDSRPVGMATIERVGEQLLADLKVPDSLLDSVPCVVGMVHEAIYRSDGVREITSWELTSIMLSPGPNVDTRIRSLREQCVPGSVEISKDNQQPSLDEATQFRALAERS